MDNLFNYHTFYFKHREILKMRAMNEFFLLFYPPFFFLFQLILIKRRNHVHIQNYNLKKKPLCLYYRIIYLKLWVNLVQNKIKRNTHKNNIKICTNIYTAVTCTCVLYFSWNKFLPTKFIFLVDNLILFSLAFRYRLFF